MNADKDFGLTDLETPLSPFAQQLFFLLADADTDFLATAAAQEPPAVQETPPIQETPPVQEAPPVQETPVVTEPASIEEVTPVQEPSILNEVLAAQDPPVNEEAMTAQEAPVFEQPPQIAQAPSEPMIFPGTPEALAVRKSVLEKAAGLRAPSYILPLFRAATETCGLPRPLYSLSINSIVQNMSEIAARESELWATIRVASVRMDPDVLKLCAATNEMPSCYHLRDLLLKLLKHAGAEVDQSDLLKRQELARRAAELAEKNECILATNAVIQLDNSPGSNTTCYPTPAQTPENAATWVDDTPMSVPTSVSAFSNLETSFFSSSTPDLMSDATRDSTFGGVDISLMSTPAPVPMFTSTPASSFSYGSSALNPTFTSTHTPENSASFENFTPMSVPVRAPAHAPTSMAQAGPVKSKAAPARTPKKQAATAKATPARARKPKIPATPVRSPSSSPAAPVDSMSPLSRKSKTPYIPFNVRNLEANTARHASAKAAGFPSARAAGFPTYSLPRKTLALGNTAGFAAGNGTKFPAWPMPRQTPAVHTGTIAHGATGVTAANATTPNTNASDETTPPNVNASGTGYASATGNASNMGDTAANTSPGMDVPNRKRKNSSESEELMRKKRSALEAMSQINSATAFMKWVTMRREGRSNEECAEAMEGINAEGSIFSSNNPMAGTPRSASEVAQRANHQL